MSKAKIAVRIEGKQFNSLKEACEYLQLKDSSGLSSALNKGKKSFKGLSIERVNPVIPKRVLKFKKGNGIECPVICENLNLHFRNIKMAAAYAQVDNWTMSQKMQTAGQFKDKNGNIYKRMKPMKTRTGNVYKDTGDTVQHERPFAPRTVNKPYLQPAQNIDPTPEVKLMQESMATTEVKDKVDIAKQVLKDKAIEFLNGNKLNLAKDLIEAIEKLN